MKCHFCSTENQDNAKFCRRCGKPLTEKSVISEVPPAVQVNTESVNSMNLDKDCPHCGGHDCQPMMRNHTKIKSSGYSLTSGCCGVCLMGPVGLLCGMCGSGSKVDVKSECVWVCQKCGKEHLSQSDARSKLLAMAVNAVIVTLVCALILSGRIQYGTITALSLLLCIGIPVVLWGSIYFTLSTELGYPVARLFPSEGVIGKFIVIVLVLVVLVLIFGGPIVTDFFENV